MNKNYHIIYVFLLFAIYDKRYTTYMKIPRPVLPRRLEPLSNLARVAMSEDELDGVEITGETLGSETLKALSMTGSAVNRTDFSGVEIHSFDTKDVVFTDCNFTAAKLSEANIHTTELRGSRCTGAQFNTALIKNVSFIDCKLDLTNFRMAKLTNVLFENCVITDMDFYGAELTSIKFDGCDIDGVQFSNSKMVLVDLTGSTITSVKGVSGLKGAKISPDQLVRLAPYLAAEFGLKIV